MSTCSVVFVFSMLTAACSAAFVNFKLLVVTDKPAFVERECECVLYRQLSV
jgi:hypothetical protein